MRLQEYLKRLNKIGDRLDSAHVSRMKTATKNQLADEIERDSLALYQEWILQSGTADWSHVDGLKVKESPTLAGKDGAIVFLCEGDYIKRVPVSQFPNQPE